MNNKIFIFLVFFLVVGVYFFMGDAAEKPVDQKELIVYSGRSEPLILPIIESFEKKTGVNVVLKSGKTQELGSLLLEEGYKTVADIYIATDAGWLEKLASAGIFTPITADELVNIPNKFKSSQLLWSGVSGRARVLMINTDLVSKDEIPTSIYEIIEPKWKGKVAMAKTSNESVLAHLSAIKSIHGDQYVKNLLAGIKNNEVTLLAGHGDVRQAVARGEFSIGFVNHYYGHLQQLESENIEIIYTDQQDGQDGSMVNVSGVGIVKHGKNGQVAQEFVNFLLSADTQKQFAEVNFEFPLTTSVKSQNTKNLGEFRQMDINLHDIATMMDETTTIVKDSGV